MKNLLFLALSLCSLELMAQRHAVIFSEQGEKFTVTLNGEQINKTPLSRVKSRNLTADATKVRVVFEDSKILPVTSSIVFLEPSEERVFVLKKGSKGNYVLRFFTTGEVSSEPATQDLDATPTRQAATPTRTSTPRPAPKPTREAPIESQTKEEKTLPATDGGAASVSMNINMGGETFGMDVKVDDNSGNGGGNANINIKAPKSADVKVKSSSSSTTTTTTTTTRSRTINGQPVEYEEEVNVTGRSKRPRSNGEQDDYRGPSGCNGRPMNAASFESSLNSIQGRSFEDSKKTMALQVIRANCLTTSQIKKLLQGFTFEQTKLELAKAAYSRCIDQQNYTQINDLFTFDSSVDDLNAFIQGGGDADKD